MNSTSARFVRLGVGLAVLVTLGWVLTGQAAKPARKRISLPTDWSHRHLIFSTPRTAEQFARLNQDPRYWQQVYRRQARALPVTNANPQGWLETAFRHGNRQPLHKDWAVSLGSGASVGSPVIYPAKFSFDINAADCTNDFVIFSTGLQSSISQASIVAFNNLYTGCGGTVPSTLWAYDTTGLAPGAVKTSPFTSLDGTQVAFVQTDGVLPTGHATLVLLKWAAGGTVGAPVQPTLVSANSYPNCSLPCMAQFDLRTRINTQTDDTTSSVYYDYSNDVAWVGDSQGFLHKFTPFFSGVPAEVKDSTWPKPVGSLPMTNPVFDRISNSVFVGDAGGFLYAVDATSGGVTKSGQLDFGTGLVEGPVVDTNNQLVYVFSSSDNSASCTALANCSAVYQLSTGFTAGTTGSEVKVGDSVVSAPPNPNPMYYGGFDSSYYSSTDATGNLYVCGNTGAAATLYQVPITAGSFPLTGVGNLITRLTTTSTSTAGCSGVTDIPNPNTTGGGSERLFVSVQSDGRPLACGTGKGCVMNFVNTPWHPSTAYAVGQQILSPTLHIETVITAGTSGAMPPTWSSAAGVEVTDGSVVWIDNGVLRAFTLANWQPNHLYTSATSRIRDTQGFVQVATTPGTSGGSVPPWSNIPGATTVDGPVIWTNAGPVANLAILSTGGASGIIEDNVVNSGTLGTSQIYFTTLGDQTCVTDSNMGGCAVQASQTDLSN